MTMTVHDFHQFAKLTALVKDPQERAAVRRGLDPILGRHGYYAHVFDIQLEAAVNARNAPRQTQKTMKAWEIVRSRVSDKAITQGEVRAIAAVLGTNIAAEDRRSFAANTFFDYMMQRSQWLRQGRRPEFQNMVDDAAARAGHSVFLPVTDRYALAGALIRHIPDPEARDRLAEALEAGVGRSATGGYTLQDAIQGTLKDIADGHGAANVGESDTLLSAAQVRVFVDALATSGLPSAEVNAVGRSVAKLLGRSLKEHGIDLFNEIAVAEMVAQSAPKGAPKKPGPSLSDLVEQAGGAIDALAAGDAPAMSKGRDALGL